MNSNRFQFVAGAWLGLGLLVCMLCSFPVTTARADTPENPTNVVMRCYQDTLGRPPDAEGLAIYARHLQEGKDADWLCEQLKTSDEWKERQRQRREKIQLLMILPLLCLASGWLWAVGFGAMRRRAALVVTSAVSLVFLLLYFGAVLRFTANIPYYDDFDNLLYYSEAPPAERMSQLFGQSNEHRILTARLLTEATRLCLGSVNFTGITLAGNLCMAGLFVLYLVIGRQSNLRAVYGCALGALLFSFAPWHNMIWASAATQNITIQFFALLAFVLYFASERPAVRGLAVAAAMMSAYSNGNGLFVFPALMVTLFMRQLLAGGGPARFWQPRYLLDNGLLAGALLITAVLYFTGYHQPGHHPGLLAGLREPMAAALFFLRFTGGYFILPYPEWTTWGGLFLAVLSVRLLFLRRAYTQPALAAMLIFLLITAAVAALSRVTFGAEAAWYPRYRINSILILCSVLGLYLQCRPREKKDTTLAALVTAGSLLFWVWHGLDAREYMTRHRRTLEDKTADWYVYGSGLAYHNHLMQHAGGILDRAEQLGIYTVPPDVKKPR